MQVINLPKPKFVIDTFEGFEDEKVKIPTLILKNSLSKVLNQLRQEYLCEVIEEIEKTVYTKNDSLEFEKANNLISIDRDDLKPEYRKEYGYKLPAKWGAEPDYDCYSYKDVTVINFYNTNTKEDQTDVYNTEEILKVLKQWKEYLDKFYGETEK